MTALARQSRARHIRGAGPAPEAPQYVAALHEGQHDVHGAADVALLLFAQLLLLLCADFLRRGASG